MDAQLGAPLMNVFFLNVKKGTPYQNVICPQDITKSFPGTYDP